MTRAARTDTPARRISVRTGIVGAILGLAAMAPGALAADTIDEITPASFPLAPTGAVTVDIIGNFPVEPYSDYALEDLVPTIRIAGNGPFLPTTIVASDQTGSGLPVATHLRAKVPVEFLANPGQIGFRTADCFIQQLTVAGCGNLSERVNIPIGAEAPAPTVTVVAPAEVDVGARATLIITGTGFSEDTIFTLNGSERDATVDSATEAMIALSAADTESPAVLAIQATNPPPGGGASAVVNVTVKAPANPDPGDPNPGVKPPSPDYVGPPVVLALQPSIAPAGEPLILLGAGFGTEQGEGKLYIGGVSVGSAAIWRSGRIQAAIPASLPAGSYPVEVEAGGVRVEVGSVTVGAPIAEPPVANIVLLPGNGATVTFDASASLDPNSGASTAQGANAHAAGLSGIASILWGYGDGSTSTKVAPTYTYTKPGTYKPSVTLTSPGGASSTTSAGTVTVTRASSGALVAALPPVNFRVPSRVVFDAGAATIRPEARPYMLRLAALLNKVGRRTEVGGHTDDTGPSGFNVGLSEKRARSVRSFLVKDGRVPEGLLSAVGYGETKPLAPNDSALNRQRNRRVELKIKRDGSPIRLTTRQLLINQRLSQAALAREAAIRGRIESGLTAADIREGSLDPQNLAGGLTVGGLQQPGVAAPIRNPIKIPKISGKGKKVSRSVGQLATNQRISQAAIRRAANLEKLLNDGLTGAVVRDASLPTTKLITGLTLASSGATTPPAPISLKVPKASAKGKGTVRLTQEQLIINQRISQAAIRRLNLLRARIESGLTGSDFRDGSITAADFDL